MADRLSDYIYGISVDARLTHSQSVDFFHGVTKYIIHLMDGFGMRKVIRSYFLDDYYYGENKLKDRIENEYTLWRCVWDIIFRNAYGEPFERVARFFKVEVDDVIFLMNNLYQRDIETIQVLYYNPRKDFMKYNPILLLDKLKPKLVKMVKRRLKFVYQYDPGYSEKDFVDMTMMAAFRAYRKYDGFFVSESDALQKLLNCAKSFAMDFLNDSENQCNFRITRTESGGYSRKVLSLYGENGEDGKILMDGIPLNSHDDIYINVRIEELERLCSPGVVSYIKDVLKGQNHIDPHDDLYYTKLRSKYGVTKEQVKREVYKVIYGL